MKTQLGAKVEMNASTLPRGKRLPWEAWSTKEAF